MAYKRDKIETDPRYERIISEANQEAEKAVVIVKKGEMGYCHAFWAAKKRVLKEKYGIDWKSPAELNPHVMFD
ncbi:MAG: hypothetical protein GYA24_06065 [Candidatus Lokiarchaeota archaeon]|nr:hypothetical protein [Candidatus Lokiarchaeota archaeon]